MTKEEQLAFDDIAAAAQQVEEVLETLLPVSLAQLEKQEANMTEDGTGGPMDGLSRLISEVEGLQSPMEFTWAVVDRLTQAVYAASRAQPTVHSDVKTKLDNQIMTEEAKAQQKAQTYIPQFDQIENAANSLERALTETSSFESSVISSFNKGESKVEAQLKKVERTDVGVVKQVDRYSNDKLSALQKAVFSATQLIYRAGRGILEKLTRSAERMLSKIRSADKTEKTANKIEQKLVKISTKHDTNIRMIEDKLGEVEDLSDKAMDALDEGQTKLDDTAEEGEEFVADATDKANDRLGLVEEMQGGVTRNAEDHFENGADDLDWAIEKGVMDAEDWVAQHLDEHTTTLEDIVRDSEGAQKDFERKTKASVEGLANNMMATQSNQEAVVNNVKQIADQVKRNKLDSDTAIKEIRDAGMNAIDAVKVRNERTLEATGAAFGAADSAARRTAEYSLSNTVSDYRMGLGRIMDTADKKISRDTSEMSKDAERTVKAVKKIMRIALRHASKTDRKSADLRKIGAFFVKQWKNIAKEEAQKSKEFKKDLAEMDVKQMKSNSALRKDLDERIQKAAEKLNDEYNKVRKQVQKMDDSARVEITSKINAAKTQVGAVKVVNPEAVLAKIQSLGTSLDNFETNAIPTARIGIGNAVQSAQEQVDRIPAVVESDLTSAQKEVDQQFGTVGKAVDVMRAQLSEKLGPLMQTQEDVMREQQTTLDRTADQAGMVTRQAIAQADRLADNTEREIRKRGAALLAGKEALARKIEDVRALHGKKESETTGTLREWESLIRDADVEFQQQHAKAIADLEGESQTTLVKVKNAAAESEAKVKAALASGFKGASEQMATALDDVAKKLQMVDTTEVNRALESAKLEAKGRSAELRRDLANENGEIDALAAARVKASDDEQRQMANTLSSVDARTQSALSNAVSAGTARIGAAGEQAANDARVAGQRVREAADGVEKFADQSWSTVSKSLDAEERASADVRQYTYEAKGATRAAAGKVREAEDGVKTAAFAADTKFTREMGKAGSDMAARAAEQQRKADGTLYVMKEAAEDEKRMVEAEGQQQKRELGDLNAAAAKDIDGADQAIKGAGNALQSFEQSVERAEGDAASLGAGARPLADKIQDTLGQQDFNFHEELRKAAGARVEAIHTARSNLYEPIRTVDSAISVLEDVQGMVQKRVQDHAQKVITATDTLDKRVQALRNLEQYQEEGAVDKIHLRIHGVNDLLGKLRTWRDKAGDNTRRWREDVQAEFAAMGEEVDFADLELHAQEAQEQEMLNSALETLQKELNFDLGKLDAQSAARITAIAASAAKSISQLMMDASLTDEQRAKKLAEIKMKMKKDAMAVLNEVMGLSMEDKATGRNVDTAMSDVENSVDRMAIIDSTINKPTTHADLLNELQQLIDAARAKMSTGSLGGVDSSSLLQRGHPSAVRDYLAHADPQMRAQAEHEVDALIEESSVAEDRHALAEDRAMGASLDRLGARLKGRAATML